MLLATLSLWFLFICHMSFGKFGVFDACKMLAFGLHASDYVWCDTLKQILHDIHVDVCGSPG